MDSREVALRVLYTINTSPQYILAKAPHRVSVHANGTIGGIESNGVPLHASVSLKICANTICRSSPELRPDYTKDYSLYVLDPLEDIRSNPSMGQKTDSSGGVAVGMGLMSEVLSPDADDSILVTGTLVSSGKDEYALEVVFSLRQVARAPEYPPMYPYSLNLSAAHQPIPQNPFGQNYQNSTPSTSKRVDNHSLFTSQPLPSFSDRMIQKYATGGAARIPDLPKAEDSAKLNPARLTRAALFPTPYIGPPKRPRQKKRGQIDSDFQMSEGECSSQGVLCTTIQTDANAQRSNAGTSTSSTSVSSPSDSTQPSTSSGIGLPQAGNANILAALSAISSSSVPGSGEAPNPELVNFLKAYLAALETTRATDPTTAQSVQTSPPSQRTSGSPGHLQDKENCNPRKVKAVTTPTKGREQTAKVTSTPLNSKNVNTREHITTNSASETISVQPSVNAVGPTFNTGAVEVPSNSQESSGRNKKRKANEAELEGESGKGKSRPNIGESMLIADHVLPRVNTGWGGLRLRQDGPSSGGHKVATATVEVSTAPLQPPAPLFRSSSIANSAPVRKGKYVVPEWARNVPPPPAKRAEEPDQEVKPKPKQGKSKSSRLGGKSSLRRNSTCPRTPKKDSAAATAAFARSLSMSSAVTAGKTVSDSDSLSLPFFAQSSPVAKKSGNAFFQAFNTSPIRPKQTKPPSKKTHPSSPTTPTNSLSLSNRIPKESSTSFDSLFTPSPRRKSGSYNPPQSPSPVKRTLGSNISNLTQTFPENDKKDNTEQDAEMDDEVQTPASCSLPIASSDDVTSDEPILIQSDSSEKIHDWSSFDLPPSSPPPPSSPMLEPIEIADPPQANCDLPMPSEYTPSESTLEDFSETPTSDDPSSDAAFDCFSEDFLVQLSSSFERVADPGSMSTLFAEHSIDSAYMALQNGLGGEDLTEAWNLLDNVVGPAGGSTSAWADISQSGLNFEQSQSWFESDTSSAPTGGQQESCSTQRDSSQPLNVVIDEAATNFEALLKGCLV